jgi:uncharacterized coiled-coil DUF342 family protein
MDNQSFELLEKKIDQLLGKLNELKKENTGLKKKNQELQSKIQELTKVSETSQSMQTEIEDYRDKQDRIRLKVEGLLTKLQEFEQLD